MKHILILLAFILLNPILNQAQTVSLVKDINPGPNDGIDKWNNSAIKYNDMLLFAATDGSTGLELYTLQAGQIKLIKDINIGSADSNPENFILYNNKVYFTAYDVTHGEEIWSTDGTEAGTTLAVEAIAGSGPASGYGPGILIYGKNKKLYFSVNYDAYISDGTTAGTSKVAGLGSVDFNEDFSDVSPRVTTYGNGIAFFSKSGADISIYTLDATPILLKTITYDQYSTTNTYGISEVNAGLLFASYNSFYSQYNGLFTINKSDGSLTQIKDASNASIDVNRVIHFTNSKALFKMTSGGIYSTDGTQAGTVKITPATYTLSQGEHIPNAIVNNQIVFYGDQVFPYTKIYISDGTVAGTSILASDQSYLSNFIISGNTVSWASGLVNYFNPRIWTADVSTKVSTQVYEFIEQSSTDDAVEMMGIQDSKIYFASILKGDGREIYSLTSATLGIFSNNNNLTESYKLSTINHVDGMYTIISDSPAEKLEVIQYDLTGNILKSVTVSDNEIFTLNTVVPMSIIKVTGSKGTISYKITKN